jgi:hypothetical protein
MNPSGIPTPDGRCQHCGEADNWVQLWHSFNGTRKAYRGVKCGCGAIHVLSEQDSPSIRDVDSPIEVIRPFIYNEGNDEWKRAEGQRDRMSATTVFTTESATSGGDDGSA